MPREIDERFIEEAVERYRKIDAMLAEFNQAAKSMEVSVRSPDGLVEIVVAGDGSFRDVIISDEALEPGRTARELSRAVLTACTAAADAAEWARRKLYEETFRDYGPLP